MSSAKASNASSLVLTWRFLAFALILTGLWLFVFGSSWAPVALKLLPDSEIGLWIELIVPFLPMLFIGMGAVILTRIRRE